MMRPFLFKQLIAIAVVLLFSLEILFAAPTELSKARRLVVLSPTLVELVFELGYGDEIVGVTEFSNYPEDAKKIAVVGSYSSPSIEKIISLKPDLVIVAKEGVDEISENLKRAHLKYILISLHSLSEYKAAVLSLSHALKTDSTVEKTAKIEAIIAALDMFNESAKTLSTPPISKSVLIQVDHDPFIAAASGTFLSDALEKCGAKNIYSDSHGYIRPNLESLSHAKPGTVIVTAHVKSKTINDDIKSYWAQHASGPNMVFADPDRASRLTPRFFDEALRICKELK